MTKKKGKSVSFDAMVKFFMQHYSIPTKKDIDNLAAKIERLEKQIQASGYIDRKRKSSAYTRRRTASGDRPVSDSDTVLEVIKRFRNGVGFADIQARTGYADKKLRNIIYRLGKLDRIARERRGIYIAR